MAKTVNVYFSAAGTTRTVAHAVAAQLDEQAVDYDLIRAVPEGVVQLGPDDAAVFAVPVYAGRVPSVCIDALNRFKGASTPAAVVAVYGNRDYDDALAELRDLVDANGFAVVGAAAFVAQHSIFPQVGAGRPDEADLQAIREFGQACRKAVASGARQSIDVPGNRPYKQAKPVPLSPKASSACTACGLCASRCPAGAIDPANPRKTDADACIACAACIAICPSGARRFAGPVYAAAAAAFSMKCAKRKEPETFPPA